MNPQSNDPTRVERSRDFSLPQDFAERLPMAGVVRHLELLVRPYQLQLKPMQGGVRLIGEEVAVGLAETILDQVSGLLGAASRLDQKQIDEVAVSALNKALKYDLAFRLAGVPQPVRPMTLGQVAFMNAILHGEHDLIFGIGPTGTGKTHLAIAAGLSLLAEGRVKQMVITRPHLLWEGEAMTAPLRAEITNEGQLTSIEDELHALIGHEATKRLFAEGKIEITPLGWLRGRTFNESFIVIDEAQNLISKHMRMAVTRIGRGSRMVVAGDPQQIDLHGDELSGLPELLQLISGTDLARVHHFERREIIRNKLVAQLEALYAEKSDANLKGAV